jgi:hypothetical protein
MVLDPFLFEALKLSPPRPWGDTNYMVCEADPCVQVTLSRDTTNTMDLGGWMMVLPSDRDRMDVLAVERHLRCHLSTLWPLWEEGHVVDLEFHGLSLDRDCLLLRRKKFPGNLCYKKEKEKDLRIVVRGVWLSGRRYGMWYDVS